MQPFHARKIAFGLGLEGNQVKSGVKFLMAMYKAFTELDCDMVEVNPMVVTGEGEVIALDAKVSFDGNALFRHPQVSELRDKSQEDPRESRAADRHIRGRNAECTAGSRNEPGNRSTGR